MVVDQLLSPAPPLLHHHDHPHHHPHPPFIILILLSSSSSLFHHPHTPFNAIYVVLGHKLLALPDPPGSVRSPPLLSSIHSPSPFCIILSFCIRFQSICSPHDWSGCMRTHEDCKTTRKYSTAAHTTFCCLPRKQKLLSAVVSGRSTNDL